MLDFRYSLKTDIVFGENRSTAAGELCKKHGAKKVLVVYGGDYLQKCGLLDKILDSLRENGLSSFSPHEVIELMLYTALPRRDVNELAHRLDDAFGGVKGLLDASESELIGAGAGPASVPASGW